MCLLNNSYGIILAKSHLPSSLDLGQDLLSFSPPHITLGIEIMLGEVLHDSGMEVKTDHIPELRLKVPISGKLKDTRQVGLNFVLTPDPLHGCLGTPNSRAIAPPHSSNLNAAFHYLEAQLTNYLAEKKAA